jgi:rfaE bifunctional protein nucleotidyltransferase chain/domain
MNSCACANNGARRVKRWYGRTGCFDLLHLGHVKGLQTAKTLGDVLIVGVNSDSSVRQLKVYPRPVFPQQYRAEMLAALDCVDYVTIFDDLTPERLLAQLQPDIHCKGADYAQGKPMPEAEVVHSYGGKVGSIALVRELLYNRNPQPYQHPAKHRRELTISQAPSLAPAQILSLHLH